MKTFFSILFTIIALIASTMYYVIQDTSTVVFEPENLSQPVSEIDSVTHTPSTTDSVVNQIQTDANAFQPLPQAEQKENHLSYSASNTGSTFIEDNSTETITLEENNNQSEEETMRIQNEIRELRDDTNHILQEILNNHNR